MILPNDITTLKTGITENIGQRIIVKGSLGRSKFFEKEAIIDKTYPILFILKYDDEERNVTFSYKDVLTGTVELNVFDGKEYSPIIPPIEHMKQKKLI